MRKQVSKTLPLRLAGLPSGGGSTLEAIYKVTLEGGILHGLVELVCVVISDPKAGAKKRLIEAGFPRKHIHVCNPKDFGGDKEAFGQALLAIFDRYEIDLFGQYGWMPMTPANVLEKYRGINQHPALTPDVGGRGMYGIWPHIAIIALAQRVERKIKTFATAQLVGKQYDVGRIIHCESIPVRKDEKPQDLHKRLLPVEHRVQIRALEIVARSLEAGEPIRTRRVRFYTTREQLLLELIRDIFVIAQRAGVKA